MALAVPVPSRLDSVADVGPSLRECPICGGEAYYRRTRSAWGPSQRGSVGVSVYCGVCGCNMPAQPDEMFAAYMWNRRRRG